MRKLILIAAMFAGVAKGQTYTRTIDTIDCNRCYARTNVMIVINGVHLYRHGRLIETWKMYQYYSNGRLWRRECELIPVSAFKPSR